MIKFGRNFAQKLEVASAPPKSKGRGAFESKGGGGAFESKGGFAPLEVACVEP